MNRKIFLFFIYFLTFSVSLSAALPALSATPVEDSKPKLKRKDIKDIVIDAKNAFTNNPSNAQASKLFDVIDSVLEDLEISKKIALAKNPSANFDLYVALRDSLQEVYNQQNLLSPNWSNLSTVQKLRKTLAYLRFVYPQSQNINTLLSYVPKIRLEDEASIEAVSTQNNDIPTNQINSEASENQ